MDENLVIDGEQQEHGDHRFVEPRELFGIEAVNVVDAPSLGHAHFVKELRKFIIITAHA